MTYRAPLLSRPLSVVCRILIESCMPDASIPRPIPTTNNQHHTMFTADQTPSTTGTTFENRLLNETMLA